MKIVRKKEKEAIEKLEKITAVSLKRGFFWPTAEIYGGKAGFYSYGHLGKALKTNFEQAWREHFLKENCYEIEGSVILPKKVFEASGHLEHFNDPLVECKTCHFRFRADQFIEDNLKIKAEELTAKEMSDLIGKNKLKCPKCSSWHLSEAKWFNMMFPVTLGATGIKDTAYLTPETAQTSYLAFKREFEAARKKLPLGIAVIGKSFRNEISPRQLFFRLREFTQAELQFFFDPEKIQDVNKEQWKNISRYKLQLLPLDEKKEFIELTCDQAVKKLKLPKLYVWGLALIQDFYIDKLNLPKNIFRFRELSEKEKAFYNKLHWDIELKFETLGGFKEIGGLHYRADYDLSRHEKYSKEKMQVFYDNKKFIPHVLEFSMGVDRSLWAILDIFYKEEKERTLFEFPPILAPINAAIFPLVNKEGLPEKALEIYNLLKQNQNLKCFYDSSGSIGKRYRRMDEAGGVVSITIDNQTLKDNSITLRDRNSMKQIRIKISELKNTLQKITKGENLLKLGKEFK